MHIDGLGGVILAALGVCMLAVIVALLLPQGASGKGEANVKDNQNIHNAWPRS